MRSKEEIRTQLSEMRSCVRNGCPAAENAVELTDFAALVRMNGTYEVWTDALQEALRTKGTVHIPGRAEPYWLDDSVILTSDCHILADDDATVQLMPDITVLMLRNAHVVDGSHLPEDKSIAPDTHISIVGGRWVESLAHRMGYGKTGRFDKSRSIFGVSTCFLFSNVRDVVVENCTFHHTGGFAVQIGYAENVVCEHIRFDDCFADGLHFMGNCKNLWVHDVGGEVGDDLVAFNLYDWQNSSIHFGPMESVWCEEIRVSPNSGCKGIRILPGMYRYDDGTTVNCAPKDFVIQKVTGIRTFKMYLQTPSYPLGGEKEYGEVGTGENIYFCDIDAELDLPVDRLPDYMNSDPVTGSFAVFEIGANIHGLTLEHIRVKLYREQFPYAYVLCAGPKSVRINGREVFDPEVSCVVDGVRAVDWTVNGMPADPKAYTREIVFDHLYGEELIASGRILWDEAMPNKE